MAASAHAEQPAWQRRARPLLGTLVELGVPAGTSAATVDAAFAAVARVQAVLSRFEPDSDLGRLQLLPPGEPLTLRQEAARVLRAAQALRAATGGLFDVTLGSGTWAWQCRGGRLQHDGAALCFDLGGIAKGHALDRAVAVLRRAGCPAGWVNAGGDLRAFGAVAVPLLLRDEAAGGVRRLGDLAEGAFATSRFGPGAASRLHGAADPLPPRHVSVAAPRGLWADALTKLVALTGDAAHPMLGRLHARAWLH